MKLYAIAPALVAANFEWSEENLGIFQCVEPSEPNWQLPQECGNQCSEDDKTFYSCEVSVTMNGDSFTISSNGIPDHNACAAPPRSTVEETDRTYTIPTKPEYRDGDPEDFDATNMGVVGFAMNGVPIFNPYDSSCCDAGLYELSAVDLCYAHPNGAGGQYHYHVWSECLSSCTGDSALVGVALDGFPIYGPGINPETGLVWSQSDMDACGGREDENGNYGYYVTVDFPYILQCYRGDTSNTTPSVRDGSCGLYGSECNYSGSQGGSGSGGKPPGGKPTGRKRRSGIDPTTAWIQEQLDFHGGEGPYFKAKFGLDSTGRSKRSVTALEAAIDEYMAGDAQINPGGTLSKEIFLEHLAYECDACNGRRELVGTCNAIRKDNCSGQCWEYGLEGVLGDVFECEADAEVIPVDVTDENDSDDDDEVVDEEVDDAGEEGDEDKPAISGDDGKWTKCDELEEVAGGFIECSKDLCSLSCADGSDPIGSPKAKCLKNADGSFGWNKDLGSCAGADDEDGEGPPEGEKPDGEKPDDEEDDGEGPTEGEKPDGEKPDGEKPEDDKPEDGKPEPPAPVGEDGKWQKCDELGGVMGGTIECAIDLCQLTCDDGSEVVDGSSKAKCIKNQDKTFLWNKDLGNCGMAMDDEEGQDGEKPDGEKPDGEKPEDDKPEGDKPEGDKPEAPEPSGEDGKWQKCDALDGVFGGAIECAVDTCVLTCVDGSDVVDGSPKTKCIKNKDKTFSWNKELGNCGIEMTDEKPEGDKPEDQEDKPEPSAPMGEDGKWQKCDALEGVLGGTIECAVDTCALTCADGSDPEGSSKTKCIKNKDKTFTWNKVLGSCGTIGDDTETEPAEGEADSENPGCKDVHGMITDDNLEATCKTNSAGKYQCKLQCADGLNFNGKDGKTNTKVYCKCKNGTCKWQNDNKKVINGKTMAGYTCE